MRIAINARSILLANLTGIGRYTYHLLNSLGQVDQTNTYVIHVPKRLFDFKRHLPSLPYKNFEPHVDLFKRGVGKTDIYHLPSPDTIGPYQGKLVVTVHDLVYKTYPQSHTQETIELTEKHMQQVIKRADHIICISNRTRDDLHRFFDLPQEKSTVVYNGVDHKQFYSMNESEKQQAKEILVQMGVVGPFLLFVGTIEPRKNLTGLMAAFTALKQKKIFQGKLVVVGMKGWMTEKIYPLLKSFNIQEDVIFTGFVSDEQVRYFYNLAEVFAFPSLYEGFGFPILEAFCCGAAVVTSNTSSCEEIATDAALIINPESVEELTKGISQMLLDTKLNQAYRLKALQRAQQFSFDKTAKETLRVYENLI